MANSNIDTPETKEKTKYSKHSNWIFVLTFILPFAYRAVDMERKVVGLVGTRWVSLVETLKNDSVILFSMACILCVFAVGRRRWICVPAATAAASLYGIAFMDVLVFEQFNQRLNLADIAKYGAYVPAYVMDFNLELLTTSILGMCALTFVVYLMLTTFRRLYQRNARTVLYLIAPSIGLFLWSLSGSDAGYVHYRFYQNVFDYNRTMYSEFRDYSKEFSSGVGDPFEWNCRGIETESGPIIIYMVESLSSYHSKFFGGHNDWTPNLDSIAQEHLAFTNFYANGFTTEDGELALLTAQHSIYPPNTFTTGGGNDFAGYWSIENTLPNILNQREYETLFVTTADLEFSSTGHWARSLGFVEAEGSEAEFYKDYRRYHFDAAPDEALVGRIIEIVESKRNMNYFIFSKSVSSHHPHIDPESGERSEELVIRYTDRQIGNLVSRLEELEFFERGHLIIVGDHRAMTPLTGQEVEKFGYDRAYTQVPAVLISPTIEPRNERIDKAFTQVDIGNALIGLFSGNLCTNPVVGSAFGVGAVSPDYVLHRRGDRRNQFSIFKGGLNGIITLNGDDTRFEGAGFEQDEMRVLEEYVNYQRIAARNRLTKRSMK